VDLAWVHMVGTTRKMNSSNSYNELSFKILNNLGVVHIVTNMFQTPTIGSIDCPIHSFILREMKNSLELQVVEEDHEIIFTHIL